MNEHKNFLEDLEKISDPKKSGFTKLKEFKYNWVMVIVSLSIALMTVLILFIDKGFIFDENNKLKFSDYTIVVLFITFIVMSFFLLLNSILDKSFIKNYSEQSYHRDSFIDIFKKLIDTHNYKSAELDKYLQELKQITENLDKSPIENLISWENSEKIEMSAEKVWAISYSLKWLTEDRINEILIELAKPENSNREYHFIVLKKSDSYARINLVKKLKKEFSKNYLKVKDKEFHFGERFFILYDLNEISVPLPNDIAIYQNFPDKGKLANEYVVINTDEFHDFETNLKFNYDFKFEDNEQIIRVKKWFEDTWKRLLFEYTERQNAKEND